MKREGNIKFSFSKKSLLVIFFMVFCTVYSFGQQIRFVWSTVDGSEARVIPMSSVRAEVMNLYNRYSWMRFEADLAGKYFMDRTERRNVIVDLYNLGFDDLYTQQYRRQIISWYDAHKNFAYMCNIGSGMVIVSFVTSDTVMQVTFGSTQFPGWFPTQNADNKNLFEGWIDWLLAHR